MSCPKVKKISAYGSVLCLFLSVATPIALGQTASTGALTGTVVDPAGASVPDVQIKVTNEATGDTRTVVSQSNGIYVVPLLLPGSYRLEASKNGFRVTVLKGVRVNVTETGTLNVSLQLGAMTETVTVEATAEQLQTESSVLGRVTNEQMVSTLPLVTRNYTQIL